MCFYVTAVLAILGTIMYVAHPSIGHGEHEHLGYSFVLTVLGGVGIGASGAMAISRARRFHNFEYRDRSALI